MVEREGFIAGMFKIEPGVGVLPPRMSIDVGEDVRRNDNDVLFEIGSSLRSE